MSEVREAARSSLTAGDMIGVVLAALTVGGLVLFPIAGPDFAAMYATFDAELPMLTRWVLQPWFAPALALLPAGGLAFALIPRGSLVARRVSIVTAFVLGASMLVLCVVGAYLPVYQLAGAVSR